MGTQQLTKRYPVELLWKRDKEIGVYALLRAAGVPVPDVVGIVEDGVVLTRLAGRQLADSDDVLAWNRAVGALLRRVHAVAFDRFGYIGGNGLVDPRVSNVEYMQEQFTRKLPALDADLRRAVERRLADAQPVLAACRRAVLCHNDIHPGNVLVDDRMHVVGLIDVENAVAGDPLLDLAKAYCYAPRHDESTLAALIEGYGNVREGWREAIDLYVLWHWLELYEWYVRIGHDAAPELLGAIARAAVVRPAASPPR